MNENEKRIWQLVNKKDKSGLTPAEQNELQALQEKWYETHDQGYRRQTLSCFF